MCAKNITLMCRSLSNISLVKKNAMVGAEIATAVSSFSSCSFNVSTRTIQSLELPRSGVTKSRVVCVGGSVMDIVAKPNIDGRLIIGSSNPGKIHRSDGGVGRNVAEVLGCVYLLPSLIFCCHYFLSPS